MLTENIQNRKLTNATEEFQSHCTLVWGETNCLKTHAMTWWYDITTSIMASSGVVKRWSIDCVIPSPNSGGACCINLRTTFWITAMNKVSHLQQLVLGFAVCTGLEGESGVPISVSPLCYRPTGKKYLFSIAVTRCRNAKLAKNQRRRWKCRPAVQETSGRFVPATSHMHSQVVWLIMSTGKEERAGTKVGASFARGAKETRRRRRHCAQNGKE